MAGLAVTQLRHVADHRHRPAAPTTSAVRPPPSHAANDVLDLASGPAGTWLLTGGALTEVAGTRVLRAAPLGHVRLPSDSEPRLVMDPASGDIWVVVADTVPTQLIEYDASTLHRVRSITWSVLVHDAAAYQGHLFLVTDLGVADLVPGARAPRLIAGLGAANGPIALDAVRHRVIVMNVGYPTRVWTYRPGQYPIRTGVGLAFGGGTITVVGAAIWVGGFTDRRAVLERLDPVTLQPMRRAAVAPFGPGAVIVAGGASVVWVRSGNGTDLLACVSARTGRVEQTWHIPGFVAVASGPGAALVATPRVASALILAGCRG